MPRQLSPGTPRLWSALSATEFAGKPATLRTWLTQGNAAATNLCGPLQTTLLLPEDAEFSMSSSKGILNCAEPATGASQGGCESRLRSETGPSFSGWLRSVRAGDRAFNLRGGFHQREIWSARLIVPSSTKVRNWARVVGACEDWPASSGSGCCCCHFACHAGCPCCGLDMEAN